MNIIRFSHNWNHKLNKSIFTTIRKYDYKKWNYYKAQEGSPFKVMLNDTDVGDAKLLDAEYTVLKQLPIGLICTDTGMNQEESFSLFKKFGIDKQDQVIILTFRRTASEK